MRTCFRLLTLFLCYHFGKCIAPYFPGQIAFRIDGENVTYAIDKINRRAFISRSYEHSPTVNAFLMLHFPYAEPYAPQSQYTTELTGNGEDFDSCTYASYWAYGGKQNSEFPQHWRHGTSVSVGDFLKFDYNLVKSTNATVDRWHSIETCRIPSIGRVYCEEIYFEKNTDIPIEYNYIRTDGKTKTRQTMRFTDVTVDESIIHNKYFQKIPTDWTRRCTDLNLVFLISDATVLVNVNETAGISLWMSTPPRLINGNNDTVIVTWSITSECPDCFTWTPKRFVFDGKNFMAKQTLTITRVKSGSYALLSSVIQGGGFDHSSKYQKTITIA